MSHSRDSQKSKVYAAESSMRSAATPILELEAIATRIVKSAWFNKQLGRWKTANQINSARIVSNSACNSSVPTQFMREVKLRVHEYTPLAVMHSLAHLLTEATTEYEHAWHGPEYARAMLAITARWHGDQAKRDLHDRYKTYRVKTRVYRPETREAASMRAKNRLAQEDLIALHRELSGE